MGTEHKMLISRNKTVTELAKDCCDRLYFWFIHQTLIIVYWLCLLVTQIFLARLFFRPSPAAPPVVTPLLYVTVHQVLHEIRFRQ